MDAEELGERGLVERRVVEGGAAQRQQGPPEAQPVRDRQVAIPRQAAGEVQRRREAVAAQPGHCSAGRDDRELEAVLQHHGVRGADPFEEPPVGGAAAQEDVLAVVERQPMSAERPGRSAEPGLALEQRHVGALVDERQRGAQSGQPAADDNDVASHCVPRPRRPSLATRSLALARSHASTGLLLPFTPTPA